MDGVILADRYDNRRVAVSARSYKGVYAGPTSGAAKLGL